MSLHKIFILTISVISIFGLIMVASASSFQSQRLFENSLQLFFKQLTQGFLIGVGGFVIAYFAISPSLVKKFSILFFSLALCLLVLVFFPSLGIDSGGSYRWVQIGGFSFQPSEFAKIALIFYLASWLASHKKELSSFSQGFLPGLLVTAAIPFLILFEPNVSNFGISAAIILFMLFSAGARVVHLTGFILMIFLIGAVAVFFVPHRLERVRSVLNPAHDPQGASYQLNQSLIAIGSGGVSGKGLGLSTQKMVALPEVSGDAIFAVIAEEFGFAGGVFLVLLYLAIFIEGMLIAEHTKDAFSKYFVVGFVALISLQAFINMSAVSGLLPLTGVTLPFISYGGSSLVALLTGSGLVAQIAKTA